MRQNNTNMRLREETVENIFFSQPRGLRQCNATGRGELSTRDTEFGVSRLVHSLVVYRANSLPSHVATTLTSRPSLYPTRMTTSIATTTCDASPSCRHLAGISSSLTSSVEISLLSAIGVSASSRVNDDDNEG